MRVKIALLALLPLLVSLATVSVTAAVAQVKYVDRAGVTHWVQSEAQVPAEYKAGLDRPALPGLGNGDAKQRKAYQEQLDSKMAEIDRVNAKAARKAEKLEQERRAKAREFLWDALDAHDQVKGRRRP